MDSWMIYISVVHLRTFWAKTQPTSTDLVLTMLTVTECNVKSHDTIKQRQLFLQKGLTISLPSLSAPPWDILLKWGGTGAIINLERTTLCDEITPQCILMHQRGKPCVCSWPKWEYFGWKWWATAVKQTSVFPEQWGCFKGMQCGWWDGVMGFFYAWMIVIHNYTFLPCFWWSFFDKLTWIRSFTSNSKSKCD